MLLLYNGSFTAEEGSKDGEIHLPSLLLDKIDWRELRHMPFKELNWMVWDTNGCFLGGIGITGYEKNRKIL